jgi:hypothetical protein
MMEFLALVSTLATGMEDVGMEDVGDTVVDMVDTATSMDMMGIE